LKTISFVHQSKAQLPELQAYTEYFRQHYNVAINTPEANLQSYDIVWFFMGFFRYKPQPHQFVVHEYASLSTPPFARLKDTLKKVLNSRPHLRVFQNQQQSARLNFNDNIVTKYRDMGLSSHFVTQPNTEKKCDLIYVGSMDKSRHLEYALDTVLKLHADASVWLVGEPSPYLMKRYQQHANVRFVGPVPYSQVPQMLNQARFGLNYVPNKYPYYFQTSTKLLEYAACGLPVIGNKTDWVDSFLAKHQMQYHDLNQLSAWPQAKPVNMLNDPLTAWSWQQRIADANFETILPR
jgi:glycosyltransferase involved in cell wall biosynthesis